MTKNAFWESKISAIILVFSRGIKPVVILMHTLMGYGVDFMQGSYKWHGVAPSNEQLASALSQLKETLGDY